jgi:hypothetical protein
LIAGFPIALRAALPPISAYEEKLKSGWGLEKVLRRLQKDAREEEQKMRAAYLDAKKKLERARRDTGFGPQKNRGSLDTHFAEQLKELKNRGAWYAKRLEGASRRSPTAGSPPQPVAPPPPKPSPAPLAAPFPGSDVSTPGSPPASAMKTTPPPAPAPAGEITRLQAWQPRELEFNDTPLAQVVAEFNSSNRVKLVIDDLQLASLPVGASLHSDNVDGFVRLLEASLRVQAERRADGVIVLRRAE